MDKRDKIVLAIDLDETVFSYLNGIKGFLLSRYDREIVGMPSSYNLTECGWFTDDEEFHRIHGEAVEEGLYRNLIPYQDASWAIWSLVDSGLYQSNILTSRFVNPGQHSKVVSDTAASLDRNNIPHSNLLFLKNKTLFNADAYIDDSPANLHALQEAGRFTITYDQEYNHDVPGERAQNWYDVREILNRKFGVSREFELSENR